jgi:hypothetical protein
MTLITGEFGFGAFRTATEWTASGPAAGKRDSIFVRAELERDEVVVVVVVVEVVDVEPAEARDGRTTAAENPATATRADAMRTRRLTKLRRRQ